MVADSLAAVINKYKIPGLPMPSVQNPFGMQSTSSGIPIVPMSAIRSALAKEGV